MGEKPSDIRKTMDYLFGGDFDACNVLVITPMRKLEDTDPYFCLINNCSKSTRDYVRINVFGYMVEIPNKVGVDILPLLQGKRVREIKHFIKNDEEITRLIGQKEISIQENITAAKMYGTDYGLVLHKWRRGKLVVEKEELGMPAVKLSQEAARAYIRLGDQYRVLSCLKQGEFLQYFHERYPSEIDPYRTQGVNGYENMSIEFLEEFENAYFKLVQQYHDRRNH